MKRFDNLYPHLFSPLTIRNTTFKNRIYTAPQGGVFNVDYIGDSLTLGNNLSEFGAVYFGNKARGGAGFIESMEIYVDDREGIAHPHQVVLHGDRSTPTLMRYTSYIRTYGAVPSMLLAYGGKDAKPVWNEGRLPKGPVQTIMPDGVQVLQMTEDDMFRIAGQYARAAVLARNTGFGAVTFHAGHSWMIHQFLSPLENRRTDKYGGSLENRARFPIMLIDAVRKAVGEEMILNMRVSVEEMLPGGMGKEETVEFLRMVEGKVDVVNCSTSSRRQPLGRAIVHPTRFRPEGVFIDLAEYVKKSGVKMAISGIGGINTPEYADRLIAEGVCDFVGMNRSFIADPDWGEKARAGRPEDIRPCIRCLRCLDVRDPRRMVCTVNPEYGQWPMHHKYFQNISEPRDVAIVGGGPSGMQAAITAAESGHRVTLFERGPRLGGKLAHTEGVAFKSFMSRYMHWLMVHVQSDPNITVKLDTEATPERLAADDFDTVIVAVGAEMFTPPIPGADGANVMGALDAFDRPEDVGQNVTVVGGGSVGTELALHLAQLGRSVTLLEMTGKLAADMADTERYDTLNFLSASGARTLLNTRCSRIDETGLEVVGEDGRPLYLPADTVVMAAGMRIDKKARDSFDGCAYDVIKVGDCAKLGNLMDATRTGHEAILRVNTVNAEPWRKR